VLISRGEDIMRPGIVCIVFALSWAGQTACSSSDAPGDGASSTLELDVAGGATAIPDDTQPSEDVELGADAVSPLDVGLQADVESAVDTSGEPDAAEISEVAVEEDTEAPSDDAVVADAVGPPDVMWVSDGVVAGDLDGVVAGDLDVSDVGSEAVDVVEVGPEVVEAEDVSGPPIPDDLWLFSVHAATKTLLKVDVETGAAEAWCTLPDGVTNYPSLTFDRNNGLLASRASKPWGLDQIDPCTCEVTPVGEYGTVTEVNGITADQGFDLFGIASGSNQLVSISSQTAAATVVGDLEVNFTTGGATWSDAANALYAINGGDDALYTIDPGTGATVAVTPLGYDFGTVGMERHPLNGVLYACSTLGDLLSVDPASGDVTVIGPMGWDGACTNLAAPYEWVPCVDGE
jgi:hypothetical protein